MHLPTTPCCAPTRALGGAELRECGRATPRKQKIRRPIAAAASCGCLTGICATLHRHPYPVSAGAPPRAFTQSTMVVQRHAAQAENSATPRRRRIMRSPGVHMRQAASATVPVVSAVALPRAFTQSTVVVVRHAAQPEKSATPPPPPHHAVAWSAPAPSCVGVPRPRAAGIIS